MKIIYKFIGVEHNFIAHQIARPVNTVIFQRAQSFLIQMHLECLIDYIKKTPIDTFIRKYFMKKRKSKKDIINPNTKRKLVEYYKKSNIKLGQMIDRDFSKWNRL